MTYTFTEDEIKMFLNWAMYAEGERANGLDPEETALVKKLDKIIKPTFDEMSNEEKISQFITDSGYPWTWTCPSDDTRTYFILEREGKEEKLVPTDLEYKKAVKEIVNYYED